MIVSKEYKFVFIGLPFSASSAITRDLYNSMIKILSIGKPMMIQATESGYNRMNDVNG